MRDAERQKIEDIRATVIKALDALHDHDVPTRRGRPRKLRLVSPGIAVIKADETGQGLRSYIAWLGTGLYGLGGDEELFASFRAILATRPERRAYNRIALAELWSEIGAPPVARETA